MPDPINPNPFQLDLFAVGANCVDSLTLYNADEQDCGCAELRTRDEAGETWHCEARAPGKVFSKTATSLTDALAYLKHKRDELHPGGFIVALAEFRIDPPG